MENHIVDLHLSDRATRQKWQQFLESLGIHNFSDAEVDKIDFTLGLLDEQGQLVGTGNRKSTRLNSSHVKRSRMASSA